MLDLAPCAPIDKFFINNCAWCQVAPLSHHVRGPCGANSGDSDSQISGASNPIAGGIEGSFKKHWGRKSRRGQGRPLVSMEIRSLVPRMAVENDWGAPRIHAELLKLGFDVSRATVSRHLPKRPAEPDKVERWKRFLRNHLPDIEACPELRRRAMDFFASPSASLSADKDNSVRSHHAGVLPLLSCPPSNSEVVRKRAGQPRRIPKSWRPKSTVGF